jgi:DNA-binding transcriptional regulator LsrR (DeoR family)
LKAAHLYYIQDLTMGAIAEELGTSRSSVSRLISYARKSGFVDIQVKSPHERIPRLQHGLKVSFGVNAYIVPVPDQVNSADRLERVAGSAARLLNMFVGSNATIGVAWGSTISAVSRHVVPKTTHNSTIVQLNGAAHTRSTGIVYASEILHRFGDAYGAYVQQFPAPAFFDSPSTRVAMWEERSIRRVLDVQARMDVALFGVGDPYSMIPGHVYKAGYIDPADFSELQTQGVVGDVATVFYRADGSWADIGMNSRSSGPSLDLLRSVPRRICVVSDAGKLASLHGALAGRLITDLIIDESTARQLLSCTPVQGVWPT